MELMEEKVKSGFNKTEVGLIPEDWECVVLESFTIKVGSGITPKGGSLVYTKDGRPFIRSQNIGLGRLLLEDIVFISDEIHDTFPQTEIVENDVLLNITGASIGRTAVATKEIEGGNVNQHVCIIRVIPNKVIPAYLNYMLLSNIGQKQIDSFQAGGNREGLNFRQIKSFQIPLPPTLAEQKAIASALSEVDKLLSNLDELIEKKKAIKQGAMQQLLTPPHKGGKRLAGFEGEWEEKKLGEIGEFKNGINKPKEDFGFGYPFVNLMDVFGVPVIGSNKDLGLVNSNEAEQQLYGLEEGDVLFIRSSVKPSGVGLTTLITKDLPEAVFSGFLIRYRTKNYLHKNYKRYCFNEEGFRNRIISASTVSANTNINQEALKNLSIYFPETLEEQNAIASILSNMDVEINSIVRKKSKYQQIKQGMMQELLTGKTRLL